MERTILCRFGEIGTKGRKAQNSMKRRLKEQIEKLFIGSKVEVIGGRLVIYTDWSNAQKISYLPGIVSFSPAIKISHDLNEIENTAVQLARDKQAEREIKSFAVRVKRLYLEYPVKSPDVERVVGGAIKDAINLNVDLKQPDLFIGIEILHNGTYLYTDKLRGVGGLPVGEQGSVVSLLSGGIDSPVAAFLMLKRGARITFVHFATDKGEEEKARKLYEHFLLFDHKTKFILVPHNEYLDDLRKILKKCDKERYICVFCKRRILRVAVNIAKKIKAEGVVTGDSLGQVASQTLRNIHIIQKSIDFPIYRPLIGLDKLEIEKIASNIGTYDISVSTSSQCQFVPKYPIIKGDEEEAGKLSAIIDKETET
jgi:thiamine biosynthesis protein ThiI